MGTPPFAVPSLLRLVHDGYKLVAVCTKQDKTAGRGQELSYSAVKQTALKLSLPLFQLGSLNRSENQTALARMAADLIVVVAFGQLLPPAVLNLPCYGCINVHPSLLPFHRGASPIASTILGGNKWSGVSLIQMDEGLDTGNIITQSKLLVRATDTTDTLSEKLAIVSATMLSEVLPLWVQGSIKARAQEHSEATSSISLEKGDGEIDWSLPAVDIWRMARAYQSWPGVFTKFNGKVVKLLEVYPVESELQYPTGSVVTLGRGCAVCTGQGLLELRRLQVEGKRALSAIEFLNGQRTFIGSRLPC